jgi:hypothetical protein
MSIEMHVFFRGKLPTKAALTRAMKDLGFPLSITPSKGSLEQQKGFMPMRLNREETGVEFDVFEGRETIEEVTHDFDVDPRFDRSANFRWGGDETEMVCGLCAGAALAKLVDGVFFDTEGGKLLTPEEAISMARETLASVVKPAAPKQPGTRHADIKRYLGGLLDQRNDLMLVGRLLLIRPMRHLLRGALFDRTSDKYQLRMRRYIAPLYDQRGDVREVTHDGSIGVGYDDEDMTHLDVRDPHFKALLMDFLKRTLDELGRVTTLDDFAARLARVDRFDEAGVKAAFLAGGPDQAVQFMRGVAERAPRWWESRADALRGVVTQDVSSVCVEHHDREARTAEALELGDAWEPSPFPVEVPASERKKKKSAEHVFRPVLWPTPPPGLFGELPDNPGEVQYASGLHWRALQPCLLEPLTADQAADRHRVLESYVQVVRLPDGLLLTIHRAAKCGSSTASQDAPIEIGVGLYGSAVRAHLSVETDEHQKDRLRLHRLSVNERFAHVNLWQWQLVEGERSIHDDRDTERIYRSKWLRATERDSFTCAIPAFGDYTGLLDALQSILQREGFGEIT